MGTCLINKFAFPSATQKLDYSDMLGDKLHEIIYTSSHYPKEEKHLYLGVYLPVSKPHIYFIYCHANAETLYYINYFMNYSANCYDSAFVAFDWCGYGMSSGKQSTEIDLYEGCDQVYNYLVNDMKIMPSEIAFWGRSIGNVGASYLANKHPDAAFVILQSPIASAFNAVFKHVGCTACDSLMVESRIGYIKMPIYLIHGQDDKMVDIRNSELLFDTFVQQNAGNYQDQQSVFQEDHYYQKISYKRFKNLNYYVIEKGGHNDLDSVFKRQMMFIVKGAIMNKCGQVWD